MKDRAMKHVIVLYALFSTFLARGSVLASVTVYSSVGNPNAKTQWQSAAGPYSTITFAELGLPSGTWLNEQYAYLGVHFTDGSDQIYQNAGFLQDGWGLNGALDESTLKFDAPMTTIAADFPGTVKIQLYSQGTLIYSSPLLGTSGLGHFVGLISTDPFDKAILTDIGLFIDNLYFGPPIPAPGALAMLALSALAAPHRRRRA
jgi:hypothetical protein